MCHTGWSDSALAGNNPLPRDGSILVLPTVQGGFVAPARKCRVHHKMKRCKTMLPGEGRFPLLVHDRHFMVLYQRGELN